MDVGVTVYVQFTKKNTIPLNKNFVFVVCDKCVCYICICIYIYIFLIPFEIVVGHHADERVVGLFGEHDETAHGNPNGRRHASDSPQETLLAHLFHILLRPRWWLSN